MATFYFGILIKMLVDDENMNIHNTRVMTQKYTLLCVCTLFLFLSNFISDKFSDIKTLIDAKCCQDLVFKKF